ncbi:hypothetical protein [Streptomyces katrae]|uniref:Lipoprotein n=1 Tax=Streptomyces katrae TaxID=68223 RepID=A0A0F4IVY6_9ACTN|nr:hypothetical protein [Streptomyces katrae]KJY25799.1 hypothetical protein VR44_31590 [Streptomyces katrae]
MTTFSKAGARLGMLPLAVVLLLAAGCGTQRGGGAAGADRGSDPTPSGVAAPSAPADFPCPDESHAPATPSTPTAPVTPRPTEPSAAASPRAAEPGETVTSGPAAPPADHYAENHAFRVPLPLHGQSRCDGLAAVGRVERALEPLRRRGDFAPESVRTALTSLGYAAGKVRTYQNGPTGVGFLVDVGASPWCVEGTMSSASTRAEAFGGYPDGTGCEPPRGGH